MTFATERFARALASTSLVVTLLSAVAACGGGIDKGGQFAGQRCFDNSHCGAGLICVDRQCVPGSYEYADAGPSDTTPTDSDPDRDTAKRDTSKVDGPACMPGERKCQDEKTLLTCTPTGFTPIRCQGEEVCKDGECVAPCIDEDNDTYGENCSAGPDCDDENPSVNPGISEQCDTPIDDNCDMQINEGCNECCPKGCAKSQFCHNCKCEKYDPKVCKGQYQPCSSEGANNGFFCADIGGGGLRCVGLCNKNASNPADTCPTPNSACVFGDENNGICLSGCSLEQGCGVDGVGCLPYDGKREGLCVPTNPMNKIGDKCSTEDFFDCEKGAICNGGLAMGRDTGRCTEGCRPFADPNKTDCPSGKYCQPFTEQLGVCVKDNGKSEGDSCMSENTTCSEDTVGCFPAGGAGRRCLRLCRRSEGDKDCQGSDQCRSIPQNDQLGVCY